MKLSMFLLLVVVGSLAVPAGAAERHMMQQLVPADKLAAARALTSPLSKSPETVAQGKVIYDGKGACFNCHGKDGDAPEFPTHHGFWRHRTEGEIFWVIKNGSANTSMVGFGGQLTDEEIWALIQYIRNFGGEHGPGMMGRGEGMGPMMGPGGGMGGMGQGGPKGGMGGCEGEACGR
jgi:mono/diheme cytochrome c family protein